MKLLCKPPLCFELQASNRFADGRLRDLMKFMRAPTRTVPPAIARAWEGITLLPDDASLRQNNFQDTTGRLWRAG